MNKKFFYVVNLAIALALVGLVFWSAKNAEASDLLYEVTPTTATSSVSGTSFWGMRFFGITPPNWAVDRVGIYVQAFGGSGASATWNLRFRDSGNTIVATSSPQTMTTGWNYFDYPAGAELSDFGNDMRILIERSSGTGTLTTWRTVGATAPPTQNYREYHTSGSGDVYPAMRIYGIDLDDPISGGVTTRIRSQDSPLNGATTPSEIVSFQFDYFNNDTDEVPVTIAGVEIRDMTAGFEYIPLESDIIISGIGGFSQIQQLESNHLHLWRPFLRNASSTRIVYGTWFSFDVVGASAPFESYIDPETGLPINASSTSFWDFLNVPVLLKTKAPTGYIYQIGTIISGLSEISATSTPSLTLDFVSASSSISALRDVEVFSYNIVTDLIPPTMITILRALMVATLYIGLAFGIIHHSHNMFS